MGPTLANILAFLLTAIRITAYIFSETTKTPNGSAKPPITVNLFPTNHNLTATVSSHESARIMIGSAVTSDNWISNTLFMQRSKDEQIVSYENKGTHGTHRFLLSVSRLPAESTSTSVSRRKNLGATGPGILCTFGGNRHKQRNSADNS